MRRYILEIVFVLSVILLTLTQLCGCVEQPSQCGPFPRLDGNLKIEITSVTVTMSRESWNTIVDHLRKTEQWGFCTTQEGMAQ